MTKKKKGSGSDLRRKRAISVVPEALTDGDDDGEGAELRRRLFTEPGAIDEQAAAAGVEKKRRWLSRADSDPEPDEGEPDAADPSEGADLVDTEEARQAAARTAATELRTRLKEAETKPVSGRSATQRARALEAEARAQGRRAPDVARALKSPAPEAPADPIVPAAAAGKGRAATAPVLRRRRGTTELLPPPAWQRHDALVVIGALCAFLGGALLHRHLAEPKMIPVAELGLVVARPADWLAPIRIGRPTSGLAAGGASGSATGPLPFHVVYQSAISPTARLEIHIGERPATGNLRSALALERIARYGEAQWADPSSDRTIAGRDWVRTTYRYTFKSARSDAPTVARAIEYATLNGRLMYVVTVHGDEESAHRLESLVVPTLAVDPNHAAAIGPPR